MRSVEANISIGGGEDQVTGIPRTSCNINVGGCTVKAQRDLIRVGAGRYLEVIFEPSLITVVNEIDAGIHRLILHAGELRNVAMPLGWIIANKIVALAGQWRGARNSGGRVRSLKMHTNYGTRTALGVSGGWPRVDSGG